MTVTETRPDAAEQSESAAEPMPAPEPRGVGGWLATGDHRKIGRTYIAFSLVALLATVIMSLLLSVERVDQGGYEVFGVDTYFQAMTLNAQALVFMVVLPLFIGLGIYLTPLQVGARTIAYPRAAAASLWGFILGSGLVIASYGINGGPGGGDAEAVDLWILACAVLVASLALGALCIVVTVLTLRSPGMYLDRIPPFSWSMLVAGLLWLLTLPVLLGVLLLVYLDHRYGRLALGGNFDIYPWLHWTVRPPQVFLWVLPALGIIGEVVPVMARNRQRLYKTMMILVGLAGLLGFGAYTVAIWQGLTVEFHSAATAFAVYDNWLFLGNLLLLGVPLLFLFGGWADTLVRGKGVRLSAPLVYVLLAGLLLLFAAGTAAVGVFDSLDLLESTWMAGVSALAVLAGLVAALGGLHYWSVKLWGRFLPEGAGLFTALVVSAGVAVIGVGELLAGAYNQPDLLLVAARAPFNGVLVVRDTVDTANVVAAIGWGIVVFGVVIFLLSFIGGMVSRRYEAKADPWEGHTLEWATDSPPSTGNFEEVALVTSAVPILDRREARGY